MDIGTLKSLTVEGKSRILLIVLDGLGGLPGKKGETELEAARTPNLDALAVESATGLHLPIGQGITPGSGPAHLALFGYDPLAYDLGRGLLGALGLDFPIREGDVAARVNFATKSPSGAITDRRAGRIPTDVCRELCAIIDGIPHARAEVFFRPEKEHRALMVLRGEGLGHHLNDTDPQKEGLQPLPPMGSDMASQRTATIVSDVVKEVDLRLAGRDRANTILLRGFSGCMAVPSMKELFKLNAGAIAGYPMYRGVARLVGMEVVPCGDSFEDELQAFREHQGRYDFLYVHYKKTDSAGEDGNFDAKVAAIEAFDAHLPELLAVGHEVVLITGDHSTPAVLGGHSWHPVPLLLWAATTRRDVATRLTEAECLKGTIGTVPAKALLPLALAHAGRLAKFGA
jgi:2,3-bisphosphoglycerate-independent phosphoglycerate mutase